MATAIEHDARTNFNRRGLPAGYNPIAPEHILGYTTPPLRTRPAGSVAGSSTWGPLAVIAAAFAAAVYVARENVRENPRVEDGTWMMHLQQHIAALFDRIGIRGPRIRFHVSDGVLHATNVWMTGSQRIALERDATAFGYIVVIGPYTPATGGYTLRITLPEGVRANPGPAFTTEQAARAGKKLHVNYAKLDITPFLLRVGMNVEREHSNVTHGSPTLSAKIALAHLKEAPNYYKLLKAAGL